MKPKHPDDGMYCPLWRKPCVKVCHTCAFWSSVKGKNPQTGADMEQWACAVTMQNILSMESTLAQRQTQASVDALRKEVHAANDVAMVGMVARLNDRMDRVAGAQITTAASVPHHLLEG